MPSTRLFILLTGLGSTISAFQIEFYSGPDCIGLDSTILGNNSWGPANGEVFGYSGDSAGQMSQCQNLGVVSQASGMQCLHTTSTQQSSVPCAGSDGTGMSTSGQPVSYYMMLGTSCNIYYGPACDGKVIDETSIPGVFGNGFVCHFINQPTEVDTPDGISFQCQDEGGSPSSTSTSASSSTPSSDSARLARRDNHPESDEASPSLYLDSKKRSTDDNPISDSWSIRFLTTGLQDPNNFRHFEYNGTSTQSTCIKLGCSDSANAECTEYSYLQSYTPQECPSSGDCGTFFGSVEYTVAAGACSVYYSAGCQGNVVSLSPADSQCSWLDGWADTTCEVVDFETRPYTDGLSFQCSGASAASSSSASVLPEATPGPPSPSTVGISTSSASTSSVSTDSSSTNPSSTGPCSTDSTSTNPASTSPSSINSSSTSIVSVTPQPPVSTPNPAPVSTSTFSTMTIITTETLLTAVPIPT